MQTPEQRRYWANRRKAEGRLRKQLPKPREEYALLATSQTEYQELRRLHPGMKIHLDLSKQSQQQLFDTRSLRDA